MAQSQAHTGHDVGPLAGPNVSLRGEQERRSLARLVTALLDKWGLSSAEQAAMLGLSEENRSTLSRYRKGSPLADSRDLLERAGHLLGIHKSLRILFPRNRELVYGWMAAHNARMGRRPVDVIREQGFEGLLAVRRHLDFQRGR